MESTTEKKVVPKLRFGEFEEKWIIKLYEDFYSFHSTNSYSRDKLNNEKGKIKNIHYGDIHKKFSTIFDIENEIVPFINNNIDISKIKEENYCKEGDLVIADASEDYADIGKLIELQNLNNEKIVAGLHTFIARPKKTDLVIGFAAYLMQSWKFRKQVMTIAQGIKVLSLSTGRMSKLNLDIPTLPEQQKIAAFLSVVDQKIEQLTQKKSLLETYKKGVIQKIFTQDIRFTPRIEDFDYSDGIVIDLAADYPDWEEKKLGNLTFKVGKKNKHNIKYPIYSINNKIGFIKQSEQFEGLDSNFRGYDISLYKIIKKNTFAYNPARINVGSIGFSGELDNIIISSLYVCFQTLDLLINEYLSQYLNTYNFNKAVLRNVEGGVREYLFYDNFSNIKIPLPDKNEQKKIASFLNTFDKKIELVKTQLEQTKVFKKGLLQQMFV